jgi:ATP-dependent helicase/nuclease subunit A
MTAADPQIAASDPAASVFVTANAGSGKTTTLVNRVARLLLGETPPEAILCLTYTKAAAAEMQRRLFDELGAWAVMDDAPLAKKLAALDEGHQSYSDARMLFAKALETPGGLKIQTIHAFCEKLLRRFPLEAGVSPGFKVLEAAAAAEVSAKARDNLALAATAAPDGPIGRAYAHFSVELDWNSFNGMFGAFEARRGEIEAYADACGDDDGLTRDVWRVCDFTAETPPEALEAQAVAAVEWGAWKRVTEAMLASPAVTDKGVGAAMKSISPDSSFAEVWSVFSTLKGEPRARIATAKVAQGAADWMSRTQFDLNHARGRIKAARIARDTVFALTLARAYAELYEAAKAEQAGLDFGDLIERTRELLTKRADAAWVLYKLDGGIDHLLLDEAQDTAPDQWDIMHAFTDEFFAGAGAIRFGERPALRTVFAVGDEKQSIYSFQGAAPEQFLAEEGHFRALVEGAGETFLRVPLERSWRSAPEVLTFVDAVFADPVAAAGLRPGAPADEPVHHLAVRDPGGGVDLWPLEVSDEAEDMDPWLPVDHQQTQSASKKLARNIAREIKRMVETREGVFPKSGGERRPMAYGDVLILVRRRNTLFHEIIRALKREGVPVGGADRLKLSEHIAFQDLLAIGRLARFPADDLTLAALLRSPFCDVDEDGLFDLAYGRQGRLWPELQRRAGERPAFGRAVDLLSWAMAEARARAPFDLYSRLLSRLDPEGRSMRQRMLTRLGREAEDAIDAFLAEVLAAEQAGARDLEQVLDRLAASEIEVKREQEDRSGPDGGEVKVMTAHGAKGLEAPVVILPDTTTKAKAMGGPLLSVERAAGVGGFLWAPRKDDDCPASEAARARREAAAEHESLRLLYVAMTRARDRLIVCGVESRKAAFEGSWRDMVERGLERPDIAASKRMVGQGDVQIVRYGADPVQAPASARASAETTVLPAWARRLAPQEAAALRYASPSTLAEDERGPSNSPLAIRDGLGRYRRGTVIHRLLQLLPDLPAERRADAAAVLLEREPDLNPAQRAEMAQAALSVLNDDRFAAVFGPGSRPEAAIAGRAAGLPEGLAVSGRVDRLVVEKDRVLVVDFKTNRPAPERIEDADWSYKVQMAVYAAVLAEVFPGRRIEAALVWTDGPKLMAVPENIIAAALAELRAES